MYFVQSNYFDIVDNEKQVVELMRNEWFKSKKPLSLESFRKEYAKHIESMFPNVILRTTDNRVFIEDCLKYQILILTKNKPKLESPNSVPKTTKKKK